MKKSMAIFLCICCLPVFAHDIQILDWSRGPDIYREGFKRVFSYRYDSNGVMKKGLSNIWVYDDYVWYGANNDLLYINSYSGLVHRYDGNDQWIPLIEKLTNETLENFGLTGDFVSYSQLGILLYINTEKKGEYLYEVSCRDKNRIYYEYYRIWQQGKHYAATLITEKEFKAVKKIPYKNKGKIEKKDVFDTVKAYSYELDFGCKVYLEQTEYEENEESWILIKDKTGNTIYDFRKENEKDSNEDYCITLSGKAVSVNIFENAVAFFMNDFPEKRERSLVILSVTYDGVVNDNRVRVRSEPNLQSQTLRHVNTGDKVKIIDRSYEKQKIDAMNAYWYKVELPDGKTGWVYGAYVDVE